MTDDHHDLELRVALDDAEVDELERALLKARATELAEVRRRQTRLITGYGDATTRGVMDDEAVRAQRRYEALDALLAAVRTARGGSG